MDYSPEIWGPIPVTNESETSAPELDMESTIESEESKSQLDWNYIAS